MYSLVKNFEANNLLIISMPRGRISSTSQKATVYFILIIAFQMKPLA